MKKLIINFSLFLSLLTVISGCKKDLEEKFNNPEKATEANLPGLLTGILNNDRVRPSYYNVRTFLLVQPAVYSQTASFISANSAYQQNDGYIEQYWNNFYSPNANGSGVLGMYRSMELVYSSLSETEKASQEVFIQAARIVLYDQASQMVDLWGDIPFTEAASIVNTNTFSYAKYDNQKDLYNYFITELDKSATYFSTAASNSIFSKYDILSSGNLDKWRRYANSVRLRLLMRMSNSDETFAKTEVQKMLASPTQYPLVDGGNVANYSPIASDILLRPLTNFTSNLRDGLTEIGSYYAPDYMLNTVMLPANDPRIPVIFDKYGRTVSGKFVQNATYRAMPITFTSTQQEGGFADYAILDSATFLQNQYLPGPVITAPEVNFLKAEAFERWGGGDAAASYEMAVRQSITYYYYLNSINTGFTAVPAPDANTVNAFIASAATAYTGSSAQKLVKIWNQKWLHFGFLQSVQAWSEYRRTGYPQLTFPVQTLTGFENPPVRLRYPTSERSLNAANYAAVQEKDTRTTKIFWDIN